MPEADLISRLERILFESQAMLAAASDGRWDDLIEQEAARRDSIVEATHTLAPLSDQGLIERKQALIRQILVADEQIKTLTQAWMGELQGVLTSVQAERKLARAYETG